MELLIRALVERPAWALALIVAFSALALASLLDLSGPSVRLYIDPSADRFIAADSAARELRDRALRLFGSEDPVVIGIGAEDVFAPEILRHIDQMGEKLEAFDGVDRVLSLTTATDVRGSAGEIEVIALVDQVPEGAAELAALRRRVLTNPLYAERLVSRDGRATALLVTLDAVTDRELHQSRLLPEIARVARASPPPGSEVWVSGGPFIKFALARTLLLELRLFLPLVALVLATVLFLAFRDVRTVFVPLASMALATLWILGIVAATGEDLNAVTSLVPPLVATVCFTYAVHLASEHLSLVAEARGADERGAALLAALQNVATPIFATCATTAIGFLALMLTPIPAVRQFGVFSALGVVCAMVATIAVPPLLLRGRVPRPRDRSLQALHRLDRLAGLLGGTAVTRRRAVVTASLVLLGVSWIGATRIRVDTKTAADFRAGSPVRRDYEAINQRLVGATALQIVVKAETPLGFMDPEMLGELAALQDWLEEQDEIDTSLSIADYVRLLNRAFRDGDPAEFRIPGSDREVAQLLFFGVRGEVERLIDRSRTTASLIARTPLSSSETISTLVTRIEGRLAELPVGLSAGVTGNAALLARSIDDVVRGQWTGLLGAGVLIYLVLSALFASWRIGWIALFPNVVAVSFYFGLLGFSGVPLNPSTSLIGCLALGIVVDDTIHFFSRSTAQARRLADERRGAFNTLFRLVRPVTFTTLGLCAGFLVLTTSGLESRVEFGLLAACTIGAAWLVDMTLTPALCSTARIVTLWDLLRLDLGPEPQRAVPLFEGLSARQARIFALMGDLRTASPGERVLAAGESADALYIVIEGGLRVGIRRDGEWRELGRLRRGEVVGETGLLTGHRHFDVDAEVRTRLLRFTDEDFEQLARRYPRIATRVFLNLSRIQAARTAQRASAGASTGRPPDQRDVTGAPRG